MRQKNKPLQSRPNVIGIVDSQRALLTAQGLPPGAVDLLEWRADCLSAESPLPRSRFPWIVTARHPSEGGRGSLSTAARREALLRHLSGASAIDIEARSFHTMKDVIREAHCAGVQVIASFHNFQKTPSSASLEKIILRSVDAGADVVKIATVTQSSGDIARLLALLASQNIPTAAMGMGPLGMASRLIFASCGSILNYGWLDRPNVPGQWSAVEFKRLLKRMRIR